MALRSRSKTFLIAVMLGILMIEWFAPRRKKTDLYEVPRVEEHTLQIESPRAHKPAALRQIILQRPLFSSNRLPPISITNPPNGHSPGYARLSGILISRSIKGAIFAPDGGGKSLTLSEGNQVNGSTISRIEPERVLLSSGVVLKPSFKTNPVTADPGLISLPVPLTERTKNNLASTPLQRNLIGAPQVPQQESELNPNGSLYGQPGQGVPMSYHPSLIAHRNN